MSLPPQFSGHRISGPANAPHSLELYLDYVCPFSAKIWKQIYENVIPWLEEKHPGQVQIIFRNQVQPWHPTSTIVAEAALAVEQIDPYFDEAIADKSRNEQYKYLSDLAASLPKSSSSSASITQDKVFSLLQITSVTTASEATNHGNKVTNDLKYFIKLGRQNGIHVSPTALWDGLVENSISSGWTLDQWKEFFGNKL
ncbi:hypothetical protein FBU30_007902 [Linnemannia zychae]|nr:hypothetical protein FBU30_007902 [Linnemannia zychae]